MRFVGVLAGVTVIMALAGCNGDGGSSDAGSTAPVNSVTPDRLQYSKQTRFTVQGQGLVQGTSLSASGCSNIAEEAGGTETKRIFTCTISAVGIWSADVKTAAGATLISASQTVPFPQVSMKTTMGDMVFELYPDKAPITVANFMQYVNANFYNGLIFHRVVKEFVVQGGGFNAAMQHASTMAPIKLEVGKGLSNIRGSVAMARTSALDSATSEFYINTVDNIALDTNGGGYAVFGKVTSGLSVVDQINLVPTSNSVPVTPIVITSVTQIQ